MSWKMYVKTLYDKVQMNEKMHTKVQWDCQEVQLIK